MVEVSQGELWWADLPASAGSGLAFGGLCSSFKAIRSTAVVSRRWCVSAYNQSDVGGRAWKHALPARVAACPKIL